MYRVEAVAARPFPDDVMQYHIKDLEGVTLVIFADVEVARAVCQFVNTEKRVMDQFTTNKVPSGERPTE